MKQKRERDKVSGENRNLLETSLYSHVHCSSIHNCQDMEKATCPLDDEWIKKMWYRYIKIYLYICICILYILYIHIYIYPYIHICIYKCVIVVSPKKPGLISWQSKELSRVFSDTSFNSSTQPLWSNSHIHTWLTSIHDTGSVSWYYSGNHLAIYISVTNQHAAHLKLIQYHMSITPQC